jgi:hypothetical protein
VHLPLHGRPRHLHLQPGARRVRRVYLWLLPLLLDCMVTNCVMSAGMDGGVACSDLSSTGLCITGGGEISPNVAGYAATWPSCSSLSSYPASCRSWVVRSTTGGASWDKTRALSVPFPIRTVAVLPYQSAVRPTSSAGCGSRSPMICFVQSKQPLLIAAGGNFVS